MNKVKRMLIFVALLAVAVFAGLVAFWYVQTRNVEIARYSVTETDGPIEIRDYPALTVAEVTRSGSRDQAVRAGFGPLARYIFASERPGPKIAMTAPVTQHQGEGSWTVQFIMPSGYTLDSLPKPAGADVQLREEPPAHRVAIRFSGWWSDPLFTQKNAELQAWLQKKGLTTVGPPIFAYYNDPFTPGFLRRNEILYDLAP
ncbi:MAG: heme-binding protein [Aestuariivirga sp.]|uniref:SOUL family heme-binding protein n=1 Tax=Aestuariivirga sp. TaxID=2650926 RepID=UPI00301AE0F7